jgi:uncharacterized RmlC-like cupin family protein
MKRSASGFLLATTFCASMPIIGRAQDHPMPINADQLKFGPIDWISGAEGAIVSGDPSKPGMFVGELRLPAGTQIVPHWHTHAERVIVVSGTGSTGMGDTIDLQKGTLIASGTYAELPAKMPHWLVVQTPMVMVVEAEGPFDVIIVHPEDDPRKKGKM